MWYIYKHKSDVSHVTDVWHMITWLSTGCLLTAPFTQCGRKAHAIKAGRTSRVQHLLRCLPKRGLATKRKHWAHFIAAKRRGIPHIPSEMGWSDYIYNSHLSWRQTLHQGCRTNIPPRFRDIPPKICAPIKWRAAQNWQIHLWPTHSNPNPRKPYLSRLRTRKENKQILPFNKNSRK